MRYLYNRATESMLLLDDNDYIVEIPEDFPDDKDPYDYLVKWVPPAEVSDDEVGEASELFAFIGKDRDAGVVGLKQGYTVVGLTPLVATSRDKIDQDWLWDQMLHVNVEPRGETVALVRYEAVEIIRKLEPSP